MDLSNLLGKQICVKFLGGREVIGILNGFDQITNMILRDVVEIIRDTEDTSKEIRRRKLGITVIRGPAVIK
jgi:U6 snRNA-associated Sm-like protein LSm7